MQTSSRETIVDSSPKKEPADELANLDASDPDEEFEGTELTPDPIALLQGSTSEESVGYEQRRLEVGEASGSLSEYTFECEPHGAKPYFNEASEACVAECEKGMIPKSNGTWRVANATHPAKLLRIVTYCAPDHEHEKK